MVVGKVQVGEAIGTQAVEPLRVATEHEALEGGCVDGGGRALQIAHDKIG